MDLSELEVRPCGHRGAGWPSGALHLQRWDRFVVGVRTRNPEAYVADDLIWATIEEEGDLAKFWLKTRRSRGEQTDGY